MARQERPGAPSDGKLSGDSLTRFSRSLFARLFTITVNQDACRIRFEIIQQVCAYSPKEADPFLSKNLSIVFKQPYHFSKVLLLLSLFSLQMGLGESTRRL
jgi:hypothetical protein